MRYSDRGGRPLGDAACHVLIIEDQPPFARLLREAVEEAGATSVAIAATEQGAVCAAIRNAPAVVTADVDLREGSGPAAIHRIRRRFGDIPVLFITGHPGFRPAASTDPVMTKPVTYRQIIVALRRLIASRRDPRWTPASRRIVAGGGGA